MKASVIRVGMASMQVCVPDDWNDIQALIFANRNNPCGTKRGWQIRKIGDELLDGDPERVTCENHKDFVHIMLDA